MTNRTGGVLAVTAMLFSLSCGSRSPSPTAPSSTALSGTMELFSTQGDDYIFTAVLKLTAAGSDVNVATVDLSMASTPTSLSSHVNQPLTSPVMAGTYQEVRVVVPNETGHTYPTTGKATVAYHDAAGRAGSLVLLAAMPTCQTFFFSASCSPTRLVVGQTASCGGYIQTLCQPIFLPLTGDQIEWKSSVPGVVEFSGGRLTAIGVGTTKITGSNSGQTSTSTICVGAQCAAGQTAHLLIK